MQGEELSRTRGLGTEMLFRDTGGLETEMLFRDTGGLGTEMLFRDTWVWLC